jgi:hypothetical protein
MPAVLADLALAVVLALLSAVCALLRAVSSMTS